MLTVGCLQNSEGTLFAFMKRIGKVNCVVLSEDAVCHLRNERYDLASAVSAF